MATSHRHLWFISKIVCWLIDLVQVYRMKKKGAQRWLMRGKWILHNMLGNRTVGPCASTHNDTHQDIAGGWPYTENNGCRGFDTSEAAGVFCHLDVLTGEALQLLQQDHPISCYLSWERTAYSSVSSVWIWSRSGVKTKSKIRHIPLWILSTPVGTVLLTELNQSFSRDQWRKLSL